MNAQRKLVWVFGVLIAITSLSTWQVSYSQPSQASKKSRPVQPKIAKSPPAPKMPKVTVNPLNDYIVASKTIIRNQLIDYESARFQSVRAVNIILRERIAENSDERREVSTYAFCGKINSKNQFGGYTGWTDFVVVPRQELLDIRGPGSLLGGLLEVRYCRNPEISYVDDLDYYLALQATN